MQYLFVLLDVIAIILFLFIVSLKRKEKKIYVLRIYKLN